MIHREMMGVSDIVDDITYVESLQIAVETNFHVVSNSKILSSPFFNPKLYQTI